MVAWPSLTKSSSQVLDPARHPAGRHTHASASCRRCSWGEMELENRGERVQGESPPGPGSRRRRKGYSRGHSSCSTCFLELPRLLKQPKLSSYQISLKRPNSSYLKYEAWGETKGKE